MENLHRLARVYGLAHVVSNIAHVLQLNCCDLYFTGTNRQLGDHNDVKTLLSNLQFLFNFKVIQGGHMIMHACLNTVLDIVCHIMQCCMLEKIIWQGRRECMQSFPGPEPRMQLLIKVHPIYGLHRTQPPSLPSVMAVMRWPGTAGSNVGGGP